MEPGLRRLAREVKASGAVCSIQIFHVGAQGNTRYTGTPVLGPSPYVCPDIQIAARQLTVDEIERIEDEFVTAIISALDCGFDLVELHIAHGYLLHEFLSPFFNRRADAYGGTVENRLRILTNIFEKLAKRAPRAARVVGARISGDDFLPEGMTIERNRPVVELFETHQTAYWTVSAGIYETAPKKYVAMREGEYWRYAEELRRFAKAPVLAQGGIRSVRQGGAILRKGQADVFGMAQALIADPNLVKKTFEGRENEIAPCIECGRCRYLKRTDLTFDCLVEEGFHPRDMEELRHRVDPAHIAEKTPRGAPRLAKRRRIHPEGHI
jgi:2,4-dienoyl-CoA reductase-like NADH-dependent reductase (Old Yellow Enzyme family)